MQYETFGQQYGFSIVEAVVDLDGKNISPRLFALAFAALILHLMANGLSQATTESE